MPQRHHKPSVAILASGGGSTAEAFIRATQDGRVDAEVGVVITNNPTAGVLERVNELNQQYGLEIGTKVINSISHPSGKHDRGQTDEESNAICELISSGGYVHTALMGYMKRVRGPLLETFGWHTDYESVYQARLSNTHPGPLPETEDTYGIHTQERVLSLGLTVSKHTLQVVSTSIDQGPKIAEHPVEVLPNDTPQDLFDRVQIVEKTALPYAIDKFLKEQEEYQNANS